VTIYQQKTRVSITKSTSYLPPNVNTIYVSTWMLEILCQEVKRTTCLSRSRITCYLRTYGQLLNDHLNDFMLKSVASPVQRFQNFIPCCVHSTPATGIKTLPQKRENTTTPHSLKQHRSLTIAPLLRQVHSLRCQHWTRKIYKATNGYPNMSHIWIKEHQETSKSNSKRVTTFFSHTNYH
jgi:hypothetical protein